MEDPEVPIEQVHEDIHHHVHESREQWVSWVAVSTAFFAALAAVASLLAGHHSNEAMIDQIKASDSWGYYQAKGIKAAIVETRTELLAAAGKPVQAVDQEKLATYAREQEEIKAQAEEHGRDSKEHLGRHFTFAQTVTLLQVAIAVGAISVLTKRKWFWGVSLFFGLAGLLLLLKPYLS